jgi:hypothetical protein
MLRRVPTRTCKWSRPRRQHACASGTPGSEPIGDVSLAWEELQRTAEHGAEVVGLTDRLTAVRQNCFVHNLLAG